MYLTEWDVVDAMEHTAAVDRLEGWSIAFSVLEDAMNLTFGLVLHNADFKVPGKLYKLGYGESIQKSADFFWHICTRPDAVVTTRSRSTTGFLQRM